MRRAVEHTEEAGSKTVNVAAVHAALTEVTADLGRPMPAHMQQFVQQAQQEEEEQERRRQEGEGQPPGKKARSSP